MTFKTTRSSIRQNVPLIREQQSARRETAFPTLNRRCDTIPVGQVHGIRHWVTTGEYGVVEE